MPSAPAGFTTRRRKPSKGHRNWPVMERFTSRAGMASFGSSRFLRNEALHAEMAGRGFSREIRGDNGRSYQLPTAEYVIHAGSGLEGVRALAAEAAKTTGR